MELSESAPESEEEELESPCFFLCGVAYVFLLYVGSSSEVNGDTMMCWSAAVSAAVSYTSASAARQSCSFHRTFLSKIAVLLRCVAALHRLKGPVRAPQTHCPYSEFPPGCLVVQWP